MANVIKFTKAAQGHLFKHVERAKDENGDYVHFQNQNINTELSPLNYNLAPNRNKSQLDYAKERLSDVHVFNRKDVIHCYGWCVTLPKDFEKNNPTKTSKDFFDATYEFLSKRYGEKNILSAYVHMDETTPHMHFLGIPVVKDIKRGGEKLCAFELINRNELRRFHKEFYNFMNIEKGLNAKVLKDSTLEKGQTIETYTSIDDFKKSKLVETVNNTKAELSDLEARKGKILTRPELDSLKLPKSITGNLKPSKELKDIFATAQEVGSVKEMLQSNKNTLAEIERKTQELIELAPNAKKQAELILQQAYIEQDMIKSDAEMKAQEILDEAARNSESVGNWQLIDRLDKDNKQLQNNLNQFKKENEYMNAFLQSKYPKVFDELERSKKIKKTQNLNRNVEYDR